MQQTEQMAREICALDLRARALPEDEIPALVDRYWPVLANEIRQGIAVGALPFAAEEIDRLTREYRQLLDRR